MRRADNRQDSFPELFRCCDLAQAATVTRRCGLVVLTMMTDTLRDFTIPTPTIAGDITMSKGQDSKKQTKKEPTKTLKEKRAAKKDKKK